MGLKEQLSAQIKKPSTSELPQSYTSYDHDIDTFTEARKKILDLYQNYHEALQLEETLGEIDETLKESYPDTSQYVPVIGNLENQFNILKKGRRTLITEARFSFDKKHSVQDKQETAHAFVIAFTFKTINNRSAVDDSQVKVRVRHILNQPTDTEYSWLWKSNMHKPTPIFLPRYELTTDEMRSTLKEMIISSFANPIRVDIEKKVYAHGTEVDYEEPGIDFRDSPMLFEKYKGQDFSNPFEGSMERAGVISHELGRLTSIRHNLAEIIDGFQAQDKEVVVTQETMNDSLLVAVRWDIGQFNDYAAKEVIIAIQSGEQEVSNVKNPNFENGRCKVHIIGAKQDHLEVRIPITNNVSTPFLREVDNDDQEIKTALKNAFQNPRKATVISRGKVTTSVAYARPVLSSGLKKNEFLGKTKTENSNTDRETKYVYTVQTAQESQHQELTEEEEDYLLTEEEQDLRIPEGEAHGEIYWNEGHGTDEDGCDIDPS